MQVRRASWVSASESGGGVQVRTLSGTATPCRRMHAAKAVTTLGGAVVGRAACGAGAGPSGAGLAELPGPVDGGEGVAVPSKAAEPGEAEPGEAEPGGGEAAGSRPPVPPPSPPQPAVSARVAASSSAAGLVRDIGST